MIIREHKEFSDWLDEQDETLIRIIIQRIARVANGNFGDTHAMKDAKGIYELRIHYGAGYRVYYAMRGREIVILLCAGDKSTQKKDVSKAKKLNEEV
jgi:putative addiction module killer protein